MDISQIEKTVTQNVQGGRLIFSDETIGVPYIIKLFYYHMCGQQSFELTGVTYGMEAGAFHLSGSGTLPDGTACCLAMAFAVGEDGSLQVSMQEQYLFAFQGIRFGCVCSYGQDMWMVTFQPGGTVEFAALIANSLAFLGAAVPAKCFGNMGTVSALRFRFELPFAETETADVYSPERDNFTNINLQNYFSLNFETDVNLNLSGIFEGGNQVALVIDAFCFEKFGSRYEFSFRGIVKIWSLEIPFTIRYDRQMFRLSTRKDKNSSLKIPSVNELGRIVGIHDLKLPESLSRLTEFEVESIALEVSSDFSSLISFAVVVSNPNIWQLAQTPDIAITNLTTGFTKNLSGNTVFIGGDFAIAEWVVTLSAAYQTQAGWIFRCCLVNDRENPLDLGELFKRFCAFLGFPQIPFPLPKLKFIGAMAAFNLETKQFTAEMKIGKLDCEFKFLFKPKKSYYLNLKIGYEISLAELPVVGTDLHLLDGVTIRNMNLISDSDKTVLYVEIAGKLLKLELSGSPSVNNIQKVNREKTEHGSWAVSGYAINDKQKAAGGQTLLWFGLEQRFSVFTIHRLGLGFDGNTITFAFDAELTVSAFQLAVEGMAVSLEVKDHLKPSFDLAGLSVGFQNPSLSVSGGFWHFVSKEGESYDGALLVSVKTISILAAGSYSDGSFLAYGIVRAKIGGPPAFSVTGLALGFGLNQYLELPKIEDVGTYPLVAAAMNPDFTVRELLNGMKSKISMLPGQNFLAAGVSFLSFGMASSFALLTVSFGKQMEAAVLGLSNITVPPMTEKAPIAKATLALKAALLPEAGVFSFEAQLMEDSYILSQHCRLTGGFAFYLWFAGAHKGDFIITLGGYRKGYHKPEHYPEVPRLGFVWSVTPELMLRGEMYFALTPSVLCAGGKLEAVFEQGALRAWFTAYADIEIGWKPFYYELTVGVSLGASITLDFWLFSTTFTLEMAVDLYVSGPEFSGRARVKWWVISFTISFGKDAESVKTIEWDEFKKTFLQETIVSIQVTEGKLGTIKVTEQGKEKEIEILHADTARLMVESLVPSSEVTVNGVKKRSDTADAIGVLPMGEVTLVSPLAVTMSETAQDAEETVLSEYRMEMITQNVPKALWAKKKKSKSPAEENEELIKNSMTGVYLKFQPKTFTPFPEKRFLTLDMLSDYEKIEKEFTYTSVLVPAIEGIDTDFKVFQDTAGEIREKAGAFAKEMEKAGFAFEFVPNLTIMAANAKSLFNEEFMITGGNVYGSLD